MKNEVVTPRGTRLDKIIGCKVDVLIDGKIVKTYTK